MRGVTDILLPLALAVIMGSLGLSLTPADFRRVLVAPKGVTIGLVNLLLLSPLLAFGAAELFGLDPIFAVGLVLMGAAPGGVMANLLTHIARGETALSVTMTAVSSVAAVVTVPLYLTLAINHFDAGVGDDVSMLGTVARVFAITLIPLSIGMAFRARRPQRAAEIEPMVKRVSLIVFVLVVIGAVASEFDLVTESFGTVAPAALALNVAAMSISFAVARPALRSRHRQRSPRLVSPRHQRCERERRQEHERAVDRGRDRQPRVDRGGDGDRQRRVVHAQLEGDGRR